METFEPKFVKVIEAYHKRIAEENVLMQKLPKEEGMKMRDQFLLPVGEEVGRFLNSLVKASNAQTILEIGTSYGYSTLWLAEAAKHTGGKLISLELDPSKIAYAKEQLQEAGLAEFVEVREGDALENLKLAQESFDFVLLDIWKELYAPSFSLFYPKLNTGAYLIADNMLYPAIHREETAIYRKAINRTKSFNSVLLPLGSGIEISHLQA